MQTVVEAPISTESSPRPDLARWRYIVMALAVVVLFFKLGTRGLNEPDEGRYAEVGREMAASGDWLVPRFNGVEHLSKPPMTYWLIAASIKTFGVNEWAARLPAALAALGTVLAVFLMVRRATDELSGLWAAVVLLSCAEFFIVARLVTTDMLVTCFAAWSVWALWRWYTSTDRGFGKIVWFYIFLGLGMMTKGPPALIPPLFALAGLAWRNPNFRLRQLCWGRGALVFLAIGVPWYLTLAIRRPELWHYFVVREILERATTGAHGRTKPFWFFVPIMALGLFPWTIIWTFAGKLRAATARQRDFIRLCATWAALSFIMFSIVPSKLPTYVTPLYVPLAALTGMLISGRKRWPAIVAGGTLAFYLLAVILFQDIEKRLTHQRSSRKFATYIQQEDPAGTATVVQYQTFMFSLPFYLQHPVLWYHPPRPGEEVESVYEFASAHSGANILNQPEQFRQLMSGPKRVFCIASARRLARLDDEAGMSLVKLKRAGDWCLMSNQP